MRKLLSRAWVNSMLVILGLPMFLINANAKELARLQFDRTTSS
jgi:hypothetical protein